MSATCRATARFGNEVVACALPAGHDGKHEARITREKSAEHVRWSTEDKRGEAIPSTGWAEE